MCGRRPSHVFDALHNLPGRRYVWCMKTASRPVKKTQKSFADLPPIRVRREPPTIVEAVAAAQDLAEDIEQQVEIAAGLIGLPAEEVRPTSWPPSGPSPSGCRSGSSATPARAGRPGR